MKVYLIEAFERSPSMTNKHRRNRIRKLLNYSRVSSERAATHKQRHINMLDKHVYPALDRNLSAASHVRVAMGMADDHDDATYKSVRARQLAKKFIAKKGTPLQTKLSAEYANTRHKHAYWRKSDHTQAAHDRLHNARKAASATRFRYKGDAGNVHPISNRKSR